MSFSPLVFFSPTDVDFFSRHKLLLMVSGGPDSVFLAQLFARLGALAPVNFSILHVNHHLRGLESDAEEKFVRELAKRLRVDCQVRDFFSDATPGNRQAKTRQSRYTWARETALQSGAGVIVTAHHADDVFETLCMRRSRGAGIKGLIGIREKQLVLGDLWLVRPLLKLTKDEILVCLRDWQEEFCEDSSNRSRRYFRNRVRQDAVAGVSRSQKKYLLELSGVVQKLDDYFTVRARFEAIRFERQIPRDVWEVWPEELRFRVFAKKMTECGYSHQVEERHFMLFEKKQDKITLGKAVGEKKKNFIVFS